MAQFPFQNNDLPLDARVEDLISRMTIEEKAGQMMHEAPAIPRLGIPAYNWWNEGLHGVARAGIATVFPQAIGLAAMWNVPLLHRIATVIATRRAPSTTSTCARRSGPLQGAPIWCGINIFRDPAGARAREPTASAAPTAGSASRSAAGCRGQPALPQDYVATPSISRSTAAPGPPPQLDAIVSEKDLREIYLPAFEACITEAGGEHHVRLQPGQRRALLASPRLLNEILRDRTSALRGQRRWA
jgi:beta-glucosidase